jgi:hypothetical protein
MLQRPTAALQDVATTNGCRCKMLQRPTAAVARCCNAVVPELAAAVHDVDLSQRNREHLQRRVAFQRFSASSCVATFRAALREARGASS